MERKYEGEIEWKETGKKRGNYAGSLMRNEELVEETGTPKTQTRPPFTYGIQDETLGVELTFRLLCCPTRIVLLRNPVAGGNPSFLGNF
jgi:hypothetical protein